MAAPQALSTVGCFEAVHRIPGPVQPNPVAVREVPVSAQRTPVDARKIPVALRGFRWRTLESGLLLITGFKLVDNLCLSCAQPVHGKCITLPDNQ
jgi:hypothetical protein